MGRENGNDDTARREAGKKGLDRRSKKRLLIKKFGLRES